MSKIAFVSGHVELDHKTFLDHYQGPLDEAIKNQCSFVIGNAQGADTYALNYLLEKQVNPHNITIYIYSRFQKSCENYAKKGINVKSGFKSYSERDQSLTLNSDYDIAWVRSEEESKILFGNRWKPHKKSATQLNLERRRARLL